MLHHMAPIDPNVPDQLRRELHVPSLAEAKAKEAQLIQEFAARQGKKDQ